MMARKKTNREVLAAIDGVEVPLHPGHARGEMPWGPGGPRGPHGRVDVVDDPIEDSGTRVPEVREVAGTRAIITRAPDAPVWSFDMERMRGSTELPPGDVNGAIVRILPPPDASDERVAWVKARFDQAGAKVTWVGPRRHARTLPESALGKAQAAAQHASPLAVVHRLVEESNVDDRDALRSFCDAVMQRQGVS